MSVAAHAVSGRYRQLCRARQQRGAGTRRSCRLLMSGAVAFASPSCLTRGLGCVLSRRRETAVWSWPRQVCVPSHEHTRAHMRRHDNGGQKGRTHAPSQLWASCARVSASHPELQQLRRRSVGVSQDCCLVALQQACGLQLLVSATRLAGQQPYQAPTMSTCGCVVCSRPIQRAWRGIVEGHDVASK